MNQFRGGEPAGAGRASGRKYGCDLGDQLVRVEALGERGFPERLVCADRAGGAVGQPVPREDRLHAGIPRMRGVHGEIGTERSPVEPRGARARRGLERVQGGPEGVELGMHDDPGLAPIGEGVADHGIRVDGQDRPQPAGEDAGQGGLQAHTASATRKPSSAAEMMPPAKPAPSPQG